MEYKEPTRVTRQEIDNILSGRDLNSIRVALVRMALYAGNEEWALAWCLKFCNHADQETRAVAATCLGHIARIQGKLDMERAGPVLDRLLLDPATMGRAEDALNDIRRFTNWKGVTTSEGIRDNYKTEVQRLLSSQTEVLEKYDTHWRRGEYREAFRLVKATIELLKLEPSENFTSAEQDFRLNFL